MSFTRQEVADACRAWGPNLWTPKGIDGVRLLWALSGCESSFGLNCKPRHEPYYHGLAARHVNAQLDALTVKYGCDAHSSFGPWQLLLVNASQAARPEEFARIGFCAMETVSFLNLRILQHERATTVEEIAVAYNAGRWDVYFDEHAELKPNDPAGIRQYALDCESYYDHESIPGVSNAIA